MTEKPKEEAKNPGFLIDEDMKNVNLQYTELKPIEDETDFILVFQKLKSIFTNLKETDWTLQVGAINYLRRLLKYEIQMFNQSFYGLKLYPKVIELINSVRSSVAKITLVLIKELLNCCSSENEKEDKEKDIMKLVIPCLISKVNSNQTFIKNDAKECLELIIEKIKGNQTLLIFANYIQNSKKQQDISYTCSIIIKLIKNLGKDYLINNLQIPVFNEMMKSLCSFYEWKKKENEKKFREVLEAFREAMTKEEFYKKIEKCNKKEKDAIINVLEKKNNKEKVNIKRAKSITKVDLKKIFKESKNYVDGASAVPKVNTPYIKVMPNKRNLSIKNKANDEVMKENNEIK